MNGRKPTKAEQEWLTSIVELGCIVCLNEMSIYSPPEVHHINGGKKHLDTIGLCFPHHRMGKNDAECVSRHPYKHEFEQRYGTEETLLSQCIDIIGIRRDHA